MANLSAVAPRPADANWSMVPATAPDEFLLDAICQGNDAAFNALVERYHAAMIRVARAYVSSSALAEEAAQEAWIAILKGCRRFAGRSSLRTWMFRILINRAVTHAEHERRGDRFLASACVSAELREPSAETPCFHPADHPLAGSWIVPPRNWTPEEQLLASEVRQEIEEAIAALPFLQRQVITLRDVYGWSAREVCDLFGFSESNQRVLLHRGRAKVRRSLEEFLFGEEASSCRPT